MPRPAMPCSDDRLLSHWTPAEQAFAAFGLHDSAYVKPVLLDGRPAVAVHAADGRLLDHAATVELAVVMLRRQDFQPFRVH